MFLTDDKVDQEGRQLSKIFLATLIKVRYQADQLEDVDEIGFLDEV